MTTKTMQGSKLIRHDAVSTPIKGAIRLDPGRYWIGDLCYVLSDEDWDRACKDYYPDMAVRLICGEVAYLFTTYGDGNHPSSDGRWLHVDSGTIGIVPASVVTTGVEYGAVKVFREPFVCGIDKARDLLAFGDFKINLNF